MPPASVPIGIGDDAAVLAPERGRVQIVTTDSLVEDVHFRRAWSALDAIGHKALAVNLSDIAAMGGVPRAALLSLALPPAFLLEEFDALIEGVVSLAAREHVALVGGNLSRSPGPLFVDMTVIGSAHPRRVLSRAGGRAGDELFLTGSIGAAAAGLALCEAGAGRDLHDADARACIDRYERPEPRLQCGLQVGRNRGASAAIDLSDGLADAARQLAAASGVGVVLEAGALPIHPGARRRAARAGLDPVSTALGGGEDYELLFSVGRRQRRAFLAVANRCRGLVVTRVGRLTADPGAWLERDGRLEPLLGGFTHF